MRNREIKNYFQYLTGRPMKCHDKICPLRLKCLIPTGEVKGTITVFKGYVNDPNIPEYKRCNFFKRKENKK